MANDPMMQPAADKSPLFGSTRQLAGQTAARYSGSRRARILQHLKDHGPATLFEIAAALQTMEHQISGRLTELARDGFIVLTGDRRKKPETGCDAEVWRLSDRLATGHSPLATVPEIFGYPLTLMIDKELYRRLAMDPSVPGVPYTRDTAAAGGGLATTVWISLPECPGCGRELRFLPEGDKKYFSCCHEACRGTRWQVTITNPPGGSPTLALVRRAL